MPDIQLNQYERLLMQFEKVPSREDLFKAVIYYEYKFQNFKTIGENHTRELKDLEKDILEHLGKENCQIVKDYIWSLNDHNVEHRILLSEAIEALRLDSAFNRNANDSGEIIESLVATLLDFKKGDTFVDYGCGYGLILTYQTQLAHIRNNDLAGVGGLEIDPIMCDVANAIFELDVNPTPKFDIRCGNIIKEDMGYYTKGYIYPPFDRVSNISTISGETKYGRLNQWEYVWALLSHIDFREGGKAVALLYPRSLMDVNKNMTLQNIFEDERIEAIIKLPRVLTNTYINPVLVVFSASNDKVKIMDASGDAFFPGSIRRNVYLHTDKFDFKLFENVYNGNDSDYLKVVNRKYLRRFSNWNPDSVISLLHTPGGGMIPLCMLLEDLYIGPQLYPSDEYRKSTDTLYKVLTVSDISDNYSSIDYSCLKEVSETSLGRFALKKYCLKKGDVLVTTKSSKNKVTLVEEEPPDPVIPVGGIIVIRPNTEKLNPTYLKMYLESSEGQDMLKSISVGSSAVFHIPLDNFRNFMFIKPLKIEKQNEKANAYNEKLKVIRDRYRELESLEDSLKDIYKE